MISGKIARTYANIDNDVGVLIDIGASLTAGENLALHVDSRTTGFTDSETYSVGVGAGADSNNTLPADFTSRGTHMGSASNAANRSITIGVGVVLFANTVDLLAKTSKVDLTAKANATSYSPVLIGATTAFANAEVESYNNTFVHVLAAQYSGSGAPVTLHTNGDYYFRTDNGHLYLQLAGVWTDTLITLTGPRTLITGLEGVDAEARNGGDLGNVLSSPATSPACRSRSFRRRRRRWTERIASTRPSTSTRR